MILTILNQVFEIGCEIASKNDAKKICAVKAIEYFASKNIPYFTNGPFNYTACLQSLAQLLSWKPPSFAFESESHAIDSTNRKISAFTYKCLVNEKSFLSRPCTKKTLAKDESAKKAFFAICEDPELNEKIISSIKLEVNYSLIRMKQSTVDNNAQLNAFLNISDPLFFIDTQNESGALIPPKRIIDGDNQQTDSMLETNQISYKFQISNQEKLSQLYHENKSLGPPFYNFRTISDLETSDCDLLTNGFKAQLIMGDQITVSDICSSRTEASEEAAGKMIEVLKKKGLISMGLERKTDLEEGEVYDGGDIADETIQMLSGSATLEISNNPTPNGIVRHTAANLGNVSDYEPIDIISVNQYVDKKIHEQLYIPLEQKPEILKESNLEIEYQSDPESEIPTYRQLVDELCKTNHLPNPSIHFLPGPMGGFFCVVSIHKKSDSGNVILDSMTCLREHKSKAGALEDVMHDIFILLQTHHGSK